MSAVLYLSNRAGFSISRLAPLSSAYLFPVCPDRSPNTRTQELAPLPGSGNVVPDNGVSDCPPFAPAFCGDALRNPQDFRKDAALAVPCVAPNGVAPLVGIARLASISP